MIRETHFRPTFGHSNWSLMIFRFIFSIPFVDQFRKNSKNWFSRINQIVPSLPHNPSQRPSGLYQINPPNNKTSTHWKKKLSHFDLKSWVNGGSKIRESNCQFDTQYRVNLTQIFSNCSEVEFLFRQWLNFLGQNDSIFSFSVPITSIKLTISSQQQNLIWDSILGARRHCLSPSICPSLFCYEGKNLLQQTSKILFFA